MFLSVWHKAGNKAQKTFVIHSSSQPSGPLKADLFFNTLFNKRDMFDLNSIFSVDTTNYQEVLNSVNSGKAQLVDIREKSEWEAVRFKKAVNIPLSGLSKGIGIDQLRDLKNANKKIYLHCQSGSRVRMAERLLKDYGCSEFNILPTSMNTMARAGFQIAAA